MTTANTEESVYQIHKAKVLIKHPQGCYIEQIVDYAHTSIANNNTKSVRCTTFDVFEYMCNYISASEGIPRSNVYPTLYEIGYKQCDREFRLFGNSIFLDIKNLVDECYLSFERTKIDYISNPYEIFSGTKTVYARIQSPGWNRDFKDDVGAIIRGRDINLYYALKGLKVVVEEDPDYTSLKNDEIVSESLRKLKDGDTRLLEHKHTIETVLRLPNNVTDVLPIDKKPDGDNTINNNIESIHYDEEFIKMNININRLGMKLIGYEYPMLVGRIDILCKFNDIFVIIEVKKGNVGTSAIGQILKYMTTCNRPHKGMLIAESFSKPTIQTAAQLGIDLLVYHLEYDSNMKLCVVVNPL